MRPGTGASRASFSAETGASVSGIAPAVPLLRVSDEGNRTWVGGRQPQVPASGRWLATSGPAWTSRDVGQRVAGSAIRFGRRTPSDRLAAITIQFGKFATVGALGFCVDALALIFLISIGVDPYAARAASFALAAMVSWILNRNWTFRQPSGSRVDEALLLSEFMLVQTVGIICNYAIYAALISRWTVTPSSALAALAIGSAAGFLTNFAGARWLVLSAGRGQPAGRHTRQR